MNELQISLTGKITDTNFEEWKEALLKQIRSSKRELTTDDDFALAETDVKTLKAGEKSLKAAKQSALEQAAEINRLFDAIDEVSEEARQARLTLERQIKQRKEEIRDEIVDTGMQEIESYIDSQSDNFAAANNERFMSRADLESFTKGKRSTSSMQKAIDEAVAGVKHRIKARADIITANESILSAIDTEHTSLFQDQSALLGMETDALEKTVKERIDYYIKEQEKLAKEKPPEPEPEEVASDAEPEAEEATPPPESAAPAGVPVEGRFIISIEVFADKADAAEFLDELEGRFADREMVGEIRLSEE
jgi:hypothetical protein